MACEARASRAIRGAGLRLTAPRLKVLTALMHTRGHVPAREVVRRLEAGIPETRASTVYRVLSTLRDARLVSETLTASGETIYEAAIESRHHHLECRRCGAIIDVTYGYFRDLVPRLRNDYGFEVELDHISLKGVCAACRERPSGCDGAA